MRNIAFIFTYILFLVGCATNTHTTALPKANIQWPSEQNKLDPELKKAVNDFWRARQLKQWEECYELEAPSVKKKVTLDFYKLYHNGGWDIKEIQVVKAQEKNKKATILLQIQYESPENDVRQQRLLDPWIMENGKWYHQFHDPLVKPKKIKNSE